MLRIWIIKANITILCIGAYTISRKHEYFSNINKETKDKTVKCKLHLNILIRPIPIVIIRFNIILYHL